MYVKNNLKYLIYFFPFKYASEISMYYSLFVYIQEQYISSLDKNEQNTYTME